MTDVEVLRVFTAEDGTFGNPLGVVMDGAEVPDPVRRQRIAAELGYSETIFVDDPERGELRIFTPSEEIPFAGHPSVGAAWILARELGRPVTELRVPGGVVTTWAEGEAVWIRGPLASTPAWWHERLPSGRDVAGLTGPPSPAQDATQLWGWEDEAAGVLRARVFASRFGITEDEACGSASMRLAAALGREVTILHGEGSRVLARPGPPGTAEVGGLVASDGLR